MESLPTDLNSTFAENSTTDCWDCTWDYSTGKDPYGYPVGSIEYDQDGWPTVFHTGYWQDSVWRPYDILVPLLSSLSIFLSLVTIVVYVSMRVYLPSVAKYVFCSPTLQYEDVTNVCVRTFLVESHFDWSP